jgi:hypothetical protein
MNNLDVEHRGIRGTNLLSAASSGETCLTAVRLTQITPPLPLPFEGRGRGGVIIKELLRENTPLTASVYFTITSFRLVTI